MRGGGSERERELKVGEGREEHEEGKEQKRREEKKKRDWREGGRRCGVGWGAGDPRETGKREWFLNFSSHFLVDHSDGFG